MRPHRDVWTGVALIGFCGVVYYATTTFRDVPAMLSQNVPPTFFPRVVLAAITLASVALVVTSLPKHREPAPPLAKPVYVTAGLFAAAVALVPYVGMLGMVLIVSVALPLYWGERSALRIAGLALGLTAIVYFVFVVTLGLRIPKGIFG